MDASVAIRGLLMPKFIITVRSISGNSFSGNLGPIRYLAVPDDAVPAPAHQVARTEWVKQVMQTFPRDASGNATGDLLFLVHGFNTNFTNATALRDQVAAGLVGKLACTIVSFDWPSAGETFAYLEDLDTAKRTAVDLVNAAIRPLIAAQDDDCHVAVHVACHSMGAYVAREAFDHADDGTTTGSDWAINQLVLIAGDVEASDFVAGNKDTESLMGHCYRLTNYFNKYDEVLQISNIKRVGVEPRVGRVGLPADAPAKTVNMDCSAHFNKIRRQGDDPEAALLWSHSWYFADEIFYADLAQTLRGAVDRTVIAGRGTIPDSTTQTLAT
jgi:esterase/lipase superfamily enzyme